MDSRKHINIIENNEKGENENLKLKILYLYLKKFEILRIIYFFLIMEGYIYHLHPICHAWIS
jgi:hypothetical protein